MRFAPAIGYTKTVTCNSLANEILDRKYKFTIWLVGYLCSSQSLAVYDSSVHSHSAVVIDAQLGNGLEGNIKSERVANWGWEVRRVSLKTVKLQIH